MAGWQAKKFQLPNHNFETTAIKFEDGRVGLCYHGSTIWDNEGGGWEDFIAADWNTVWKEGKPCAFQDLPRDMRIACPGCGAKIHPEDMECAQCGIIFEKIKTASAPADTKPEIDQNTIKKKRSKVLDISLLSVALLIVGFFIYNTLKPDPPQPSPAAPVQEKPVAGPSEQPVRQPSTSYNTPSTYQPDIATDNQNMSSSRPRDSFVQPDAKESEQFFSHINLNDLEIASRQLQEAVQRINEEGRQIEKELVAARTPEEKQQVAAKKNIYNSKARQLSQLIKEYNAKIESTP